MAKISYVNGSYINHEDAFIHIDDRGCQFSDGVYEVIMCVDGVLVDADPHFVRLERSLSELDISKVMSVNALKLVIKELMRKNKIKTGALYIQINRGEQRRNHLYSNDLEPTIVMTFSRLKFPSDKQYKDGVMAITVPDIRWQRRDIKSISLLPNILSKKQANYNKAEEAIFCEQNQTVTEGSATNVFIIDDKNVLRTHPANNQILAGITRSGVLKVAKEIGVESLEKAFSKDELLAAKQVFITSTTKKVLPVTNVDGQKIGDGLVGDVVLKLINGYNNHINKQAVGK